jgi:hypothetical protein
MSSLGFLVIVLVISAVGIAIVLLRNRSSSSDVARVDEFKREMDALSPRQSPSDDQRGG